MTDLTRLHAHQMAARAALRRRSARELTEAHLDVAERQNHGLQRLAVIDRERALAEADAADARLARLAPTPATRWSPASAARHPGRAQGPRLGRRRPVHGRLADPRGLPGAVRRPHHRAAA